VPGFVYRLSGTTDLEGEVDGGLSDGSFAPVGSMSVTATEHKSIPVPAVVGIVSLLGSVALLVVGKRSS
jgi:hypothetical protein